MDEAGRRASQLVGEDGWIGDNEDLRRAWSIPIAEVVCEDDGTWSVSFPGLPVAATGASLDDLHTHAITAMRAYAEDWFGRPYRDVDNRGFVQLVDLSEDEELCKGVRPSNQWIQSTGLCGLSSTSDRQVFGGPAETAAA